MGASSFPVPAAAASPAPSSSGSGASSFGGSSPSAAGRSAAARGSDGRSRSEGGPARRSARRNRPREKGETRLGDEARLGHEGHRVPAPFGFVGGERRAPASIASSDRHARARVSFGSGSGEETALVAGSSARGRTGRVSGPRVRLLQARDERGFEPGRVQPLSRERLAELRDGHLPQSHRGPGGRAVASAARPASGDGKSRSGGARETTRVSFESGRGSARATRRHVNRFIIDFGRSVAKKKAPQAAKKRFQTSSGIVFAWFVTQRNRPYRV